ncbi:hypothetical protein [Spirosoma sp.]|uniref:hypothetical protein n=1 Tax=Spirosoma sp. TaxID=1899569 RepID=UPI00260BFEAC|nr:hypothetical protein [Spirosoma sp.]MCX6218249.1 hypothetical protein [Spirosoma sp.]
MPKLDHLLTNVKTLFSFAILSCLLLSNAAIAQTGVMVQDDVYIAPLSQVALFGDQLTLEADVLGDGELIMAAPISQTIDAKGHSLSRLTIENPAGVDVVSDLVVIKKLSIPQGELRLIDAQLIVPNADVIAARDRQHIRVIGQSAVVVETEFRPDNQPLTAGGGAGASNLNGVLPADAWRTHTFADAADNALIDLNATVQRSIYDEVDAPPPKA